MPNRKDVFMQLKWDQGLASRGKLMGKKTFGRQGVIEASAKVPIPSKVRWAAEVSARPRKRRKTRQASVVQLLGDLTDDDLGELTRSAPSLRHGTAAVERNSLACIAPATLSLSISPSAPVPDILFIANNAQLFNHYLTHVAKVTVVTDTDKNPFKTIILPMSFESPLIMSNILAIAAANLSNRHAEYGVIAYSHLSNSYAELKERLKKPETALSEITLAGVLGQVSYQLHHGDVANWRVHLTAARNIVKVLGGPKAVLEKNPRFKFHLQHLAWIDILASTTSPSNELGEKGYWNALLQVIRRETGTYSMSDLMGCSEEILEILAEMTQMFDQEASTKALDPELNSATLQSVAEAAVPEVSFRCPMSREKWAGSFRDRLATLKSAQPPHDAETALHELFRIAAKIYLEYRLLQSACWSTSLQRLLHEALELLELIPPRSAQEMAVPWPLFIMGSICVYAREQKIVRARYAVMTNYMGFGNIQRCAELLEKVWADWRDAEERCSSRLAGQPWDERDLGRRRWETYPFHHFPG